MNSSIPSCSGGTPIPKEVFQKACGGGKLLSLIHWGREAAEDSSWLRISHGPTRIPLASPFIPPGKARRIIQMRRLEIDAFHNNGAGHDFGMERLAVIAHRISSPNSFLRARFPEHKMKVHFAWIRGFLLWDCVRDKDGSGTSGHNQSRPWGTAGRRKQKGGPGPVCGRSVVLPHFANSWGELEHLGLEIPQKSGYNGTQKHIKGKKRSQRAPGNGIRVKG